MMENGDKAKTQIIAVLSGHTPSLFWFRMDMMQAFIAHGHTVYALGNEPEEKWSSEFIKHNIVYKQIDVQRNGINPLHDIKTLLSIKKVLQAIKPDKVFTYQAKTVIYGTIAANLLGITEVYPLIAGIGSIFLSDNLKSRIVRNIVNIQYKYSMRKCPVIFFQNHDDEKVFRESSIIKKQRIVLLHGSGVNTEKFKVFPLPEKTVFLCISRLIRNKGVYEYLEACKKLKTVYPDIRCMLVGPYDSNPSALREEDLQPYIESSVIEYFGEQENVIPYIQQSSVFVLPSYREGTPKAVLEAMACGRAVITTNAPGCKETVREGENGFMVPVKDVDALYIKMKWFAENSDIISRMGASGRKMAEEIFDVNKVNDTICEAMNI